MSAPIPAFQVSPQDNVATLLVDAVANDHVAVLGQASLVALEPITRAHKIALTAIPAGGAVIKFGAPVGHATRAIAAGAWVHLHNLASNYDLRSASLDLQSGAPSDTSTAYV